MPFILKDGKITMCHALTEKDIYTIIIVTKRKMFFDVYVA